ncbi:sensor histidine kinase [Uliginosibacterium gangwonense]|uniref:sensor histidine kinase n=1 Tax=Uliginosibacterium gangwonense TaxID=392736 RepID=UPI00146F1549|nr:HAMP domain-containing sensor histidine kinase [Uliginosibacterium gangwonense]
MGSARQTLFAARVQELLIDEHLDKSQHAYLASLMASIIILIVFYDAIKPVWILLAWMAALNGISLIRHRLARVWRTDIDRLFKASAWERKIALLSACSGALWSVPCILLLYYGNEEYRLIIAMCLMGVAAGGVLSLSILLSAYSAFYLCMLLPSIACFLLQPGTLLHWTAFILSMFLIVMMINGWRASKEVRQAMRLRLELAAAVEEAQTARRHAEEANLAKSRFLSNISHELRTPIHAILGFAQLGGERAQDQKIRDYFNRIRLSGNRLLALINDLLDLSRLEAGRLDMHFQKHALVPLVEAAVHEIESLLNERGLKVALHAQPDLPPVVCDALRVGQVVHNLLSNAVKFSPKGGDITIDVAMHAEHDRVCCFAIKDQGPGIPEDELELVFDEFVQSSKTSTGAGGSGLGLAISRRIITAHHGRIYAHNRREGGAEFVFELPLTQPGSVAINA